MDDDEWIAKVASKGWVAITHDKNIRRRPNERDAVFQSRLALLVVVGGAPTAVLAENFIATLPAIERFLRKHPAPFIARVYRPAPSDLKKRRPVGRIEMWLEE